MVGDNPHPSPAELLLKAVDALPAQERNSVLTWLLDPSPRTPRGAWWLRSYTQALAARLPELPPRTHEYIVTTPCPGLDTGADVTGEQLQVVPIRLTSNQHRRLRHWCVQHNFTMATVIRGLVDRFLDQTLNQPPPPDDPPEHPE